ncbi:MAG: GNAT family N-acetyltransferase [Chloroflexota bacterium]|nr:GNAT family N-acetyltransferase [Chloroflexota bacterium]
MIEIVPATTAEHFAQFQELVDELMAWDSAMSREIGLNLDTMLDFFYKKPPAALAAEFSPNGHVFLAKYEGRLAGCGALKELSRDAAELTRVYVRPAFRGKGLGKAIVDAVIASARQEGYATVRLETAIFMKDAHSLYRSFGFELSEPFRRVPDDLKHAEVFMELKLRGPAPTSAS